MAGSAGGSESGDTDIRFATTVDVANGGSDNITAGTDNDTVLGGRDGDTIDAVSGNNLILDLDLTRLGYQNSTVNLFWVVVTPTGQMQVDHGCYRFSD